METILLLIIKILLTVFVITFVLVYKKNYGWQNFLWLSDVGLFLTLIAFWLNSSFLISIISIVVLPFEIIWIIDFLFRLLTKRKLLSISDYMFDQENPLYGRLLSLFHVFLPVIWIWCLIMWGYDEIALPYAVLLLWLVLGVSYLFTDVERNINWVYSPAVYKWKHMSRSLWLVLLFIGIPLVIVPLHLLFIQLF